MSVAPLEKLLYVITIDFVQSCRFNNKLLRRLRQERRAPELLDRTLSTWDVVLLLILPTQVRLNLSAMRYMCKIRLNESLLMLTFMELYCHLWIDLLQLSDQEIITLLSTLFIFPCGPGHVSHACLLIHVYVQFKNFPSARSNVGKPSYLIL